MLASLRARREDERGFTLIELMVVVLIIAILIAIAIPTFLGAKSRSQDKAAQSSLRNALTNAKGIYTDSETYNSATTQALVEAEPSLQFTAGDSAGPKEVSVSAVSDTVFVAAAQSKSGKCYAIADNVNGPGTVFMLVANSGTCNAGAATTAQAVPSAVPSADPGTVGQWAQSW
jgi:type IV pilus assembly protein PilA